MDNIQFKPGAYEKAARSTDALEDDAESIYKRGGTTALMTITGIGQSIAEKIEELITNGKLQYFELRMKVAVDLDSLAGIEGLGPRKIKILARTFDPCPILY